MGTCYLIALVPFVVGAGLWLTSRRITFSEWIKGAVIGFVVAGIFHVIAIWTQTVDYEMWSGRIVRATHHPEWVGESTDDSYDVYPEKWSVTADYGALEERYEITQEEFEAFREQFGVRELETREPHKRGYSSGDPHVYVAENATGVVIPAYTVRLFENRVKASESLFSYSDAPDDAEVHEYPAELDESHLTALAVDFVSKYIDPAARDDEVMILPREWRRSPRLLGRAAEDFDLHAWDGLNAELGPAHHVNLIAIGFEGDRSNALWQEAKWVGGKKNDLVLCYGPPSGDGRPAWAYCFGWSEGEVVKRNLESILLAQPAGDAMLSAIRAEVAQNYAPRSWPEFSYLAVPAPAGAYWVLVLVTVFIQGGYWTFALLNRTHRRAASDAERVAEERQWERQKGRREEQSLEREVREHLGDLADPKDVEQLGAAMLDEGPGRGSIIAVRCLARSSDPSALPKLAVGMTHPRFRVRQEAAESLVASSANGTTASLCRDAMSELIDRLGHGSSVVRRESHRLLGLLDPEWSSSPMAAAAQERALDELRSSHAPLESHEIDRFLGTGSAAADALLPLLGHARPPVRNNALRALARTGDARAAELLFAALVRDHANWERDAVLEALANLHPRSRPESPIPAEVRAELERLVSDRDDRIVRRAIRALGKLGDPAAIELLATAVEGKRWKVRAAAIVALGDLGHPEAIEPLATLARKSESNDLLRIIGAFVAIADERAIDPLVAIDRQVGDGALLVRENIIRALGCFPGARALEALESILHRLDDCHDAELVESLRARVTEARSGEGLPIWLRGPHHSLQD